MNRLGKGPVSPYFERQIQFFMGQGKTLKDQKRQNEGKKLNHTSMRNLN